MEGEAKKHFSHHHILIPIEPKGGEEIKYCHACEEEIEEDPFYGCLDCNFFLHEICYDAPRSMVHPSHPSHPLALTPIPTYSHQSYGCDACGHLGKSFSYSCANCEFDLHLRCAMNLPENVLFEQEHPHELKLVFEPPHVASNDGSGDIVPCNICTGNQSLWLYYCEACKYATHIYCFVAKYEGKETTKLYFDGEEKATDDSSDEEVPIILIINLDD